MANKNVREFEELLRSDEKLQAALRAATEAYEGAKDDARAFFDATVGKLAEEAGLPFTFEEGKAFAAEGAEIDDADLDAVAGGGFCIGIGFGPPDAGGCEELSEYMGGGACAVVGTGGLGW